MLKIGYGLPVLAALTGMIAVSPVRAGEETERDIEKLSVVAARDYVADHDDAVIMDVRTPAEFRMSHITGAINADVQNPDFESLVAGLDRDKTYVVHCTRNPGNGRSSRALDVLKDLGFTNLYSLEGGYLAWKEASLPLTEADN